MKNLILVIKGNIFIYSVKFVLLFALLFEIVAIISINIVELLSKLEEIDSIKIL